MGLPIRMMFYMRFVQIFVKRLGQTKMRSFMAFKAKKFYIGFRPVQKLKQYSRKKRQADDEAARQALEKLKGMLLEKEKLRLALQALLPKKKKQQRQAGGILSIFEDDEVTVVTVTARKAIQEKIYKIYCGYKIEAERFFHQVHSKHIVIQINSEASSFYAESVEYEGGYQSDGSGLPLSLCSEVSARLHLAPDDTKKFVQNLQVDQDEYLAESHIVSVDEEELGESHQGDQYYGESSAGDQYSYQYGGSNESENNEQGGQVR